MRGAVGGIMALVVAMRLSFALAPAPGAASDFGFLPGLVAGAGVAGLLLRLGARDAAALDGEIARARERSAAARAAAIAAERRRLEQELLGLTKRSLAELRDAGRRRDAPAGGGRDAAAGGGRDAPAGGGAASGHGGRGQAAALRLHPRRGRGDRRRRARRPRPPRRPPARPLERRRAPTRAPIAIQR